MVSSSCGSPPLARGTRCRVEAVVLPRRLTPARAGNTPGRYHRHHRLPAHPRSRGEHPLNHRPRPPNRLTPARAGNTRRRSWKGGASSAHPRSRGEHKVTHFTLIQLYGSPPLARGTLRYSSPNALSLRLTPARAGNTNLAPLSLFPCPAHPPLARGTLQAVRL